MARLSIFILLLAGFLVGLNAFSQPEEIVEKTEREKIVFWHFWGGEERKVVQEIVRRFHESQDRYWVEEIPVPGQNLDMKFYMALAGGDFPDLVNQDDQVVAQWAHSGVILPLRKLVADENEYRQLEKWLLPTAKKIGSYQGKLYALCNALDIRALIFRNDVLNGRDPPQTIDEFDAIAKRSHDDSQSILFLPDDRRLWAWGVAFGGSFYDETTGEVTVNHPRIVEALKWMVSYTRLHGLENIRAFRSTNRETGASSMILDGRYGMMMDGQWRIPELDRSKPPLDYGVVPLPFPKGGKPNAGWVNGNFFVVPRGCRNPLGAWEFMKFWSGFGGNERHAAITATSGGWIPASRKVVVEPAFQDFLEQHPKFRIFVELADSPDQIPTPPVPIQSYFFERLNRAAEEALSLSKTPKQALDDTNKDIQRRLDNVLKRHRADKPRESRTVFSVK